MKYIWAFILLFPLSTPALYAQDICQAEKQSVIENRKRSNLAIKRHQIEGITEHLADDMAITTGNGTVIIGKDSLVNYLQVLFDRNDDLFFVREPETITLDQTCSRAWEQGTWAGFRPNTPDWENVGGNYSAMWVKIEGAWKIKSQLFVALY